MQLRKALPLALAATILGIVLGATVFRPGTATAQDDPGTTTAPATERIRSLLDELVANGTINDSQADAVAAHLANKLGGPGGHGWGRWGRGPGLFREAAEIIGITPQALRDGLRAGKTLAELAASNGIDAAELVDRLASALDDKLADAVTDGRITQEQADQINERTRTMLEAMVNGTWPQRPPRSQGTDAET
jgi:polyhydroxyalkanoate synthesis regulator phasin